jgi:hypothetical protein
MAIAGIAVNAAVFAAGIRVHRIDQRKVGAVYFIDDRTGMDGDVLDACGIWAKGYLVFVGKGVKTGIGIMSGATAHTPNIKEKPRPARG